MLHGIGTKRLKNIAHSLHQDGIQPRVYGNLRILPKHTLSLSSVEYVLRFLLNYYEQHGTFLPGRIPGYSRTDVKLLPSSVFKKGIWKTYSEAAQQLQGIVPVAYTTFCRLWRAQLPYLLFMRPATDLCWTCQKNSTAILRVANWPENAKSDVLLEAEEHLRIVKN